VGIIITSKNYEAYSSILCNMRTLDNRCFLCHLKIGDDEGYESGIFDCHLQKATPEHFKALEKWVNHLENYVLPGDLDITIKAVSDVCNAETVAEKEDVMLAAFRLVGKTVWIIHTGDDGFSSISIGSIRVTALDVTGLRLDVVFSNNSVLNTHYDKNILAELYLTPEAALSALTSKEYVEKEKK